jgi:CheY-like chemotaxis protein
MLTILVADDDADLRAALCAVLEDAGHEVVPAANGVEALAALQQKAVDVAIVDVMMPLMDGLQFYDNIRAGTLCPRLPMVMVSATRPPAHVLGGRKVPLLYKPVTGAALLEAIAKLLA